jgi:hypothetical protein
MTFDAPPVAGGTQACEGGLMSKINKTAKVQTVAYADVYAIIEPQTIHHDHDEPTFVSVNGATTWPCRARLFDTVGDAIAYKIAIGKPDARVVRVRLTYTAEAVEMRKRTKKPAEIKVMRRRKVA